jgi:predicted GTPase
MRLDQGHTVARESGGIDLTKVTTGRLITELGVRTVLALNELSDNHVTDGEREEHLTRVRFIVDGQAGVGHSKVVQRSIERCAFGAWN